MDVKEMIPKKGKKTAKPVEGAAGHALGTLVVRAAEKAAEEEVKQVESRKDTLRRIVVFTREDHLSFRKVLEDRLDTFRKAAESLGMSLEAFRASDSKANSIAVTISLWKKLSMAVEAGFSPDFSLPWAMLSVQATEILYSKGTPDENGVVRANPTKRKGRPATPVYDKVLKLLEGADDQTLQRIQVWIEAALKKAPM